MNKVIGAKESALRFFIAGWEKNLSGLRKGLEEVQRSKKQAVLEKKMEESLESLEGMAREINETVFNMKHGFWIK